MAAQQNHGITTPRFNPQHSLALDKLIIAMEAQRPAARKPLRIVKHALECGIPAAKVVR